MNSTEAGGHAPVPAAARDRRRRNSVARIVSNIKTDSLIAVRGTWHGCDACRPRWPASNRLVESLDPLPLRPRLPIKAQPPPRAAVLAMQQGDWEALRPPLHAYRRRWTFGAGSSTEGMGLNLTSVRTGTAPPRCAGPATAAAAAENRRGSPAIPAGARPRPDRHHKKRLRACRRRAR